MYQGHSSKKKDQKLAASGNAKGLGCLTEDGQVRNGDSWCTEIPEVTHCHFN